MLVTLVFRYEGDGESSKPAPVAAPPPVETPAQPSDAVKQEQSDQNQLHGQDVIEPSSMPTSRDNEEGINPAQSAAARQGDNGAAYDEDSSSNQTRGVDGSFPATVGIKEDG